MSAGTKPVNRVQDDSAQLLLVGKVGVDITSAAVEQALRHVRAKPLRVVVRSEGGCFFEASRIYYRLREHAENYFVNVTIATAFSAAAWIALAADHRVISKNGIVMLHNVVALPDGHLRTATELRETAGLLEALSALLGDIIAERTGLASDQVFELMESECHLRAQRAIELGFAHETCGNFY